MRSPPHVLYLSFNGILEPLGFSQVARVVRRLSERGVARFTLCTLESPDSLNTDHHDHVAATLARAGIAWEFRVFERGVAGVVSNLRNMHLMALNAIAESNISLVHARSYLSAQVARSCRALLGIPYLFDFRGYWVDELIAENRWITNRTSQAIAKRWERKLFQHSAGIVSLAAPALDDVRSGVFGRLQQPAWVIPTCVDEEVFSLEGRASAKRDLGLDGKLVIGFVGSLNASYRVDESIFLVGQLMALRDDVVFVGLTHQAGSLRDKLREHNVDTSRTVIESVSHNDIPRWLNAIDWGLLLLHTRYAKRASMPTKLAEFFAAGVRPIHHGCNDEVGQWVDRTGSGISLRRCDGAELQATAHVIARSNSDPTELEVARKIALPHFGLDAGVERYGEIYRQLTRL